MLTISILVKLKQSFYNRNMAMIPFQYRMDRFRPGPLNAAIDAIAPIHPIRTNNIGIENNLLENFYKKPVPITKPVAPPNTPQDAINLHYEKWNQELQQLRKTWPQHDSHTRLDALHPILVAFDGSALGWQAIDTAYFLAKYYQCEINILQVLHPDQPLNISTTEYAKKLQKEILTKIEPQSHNVHYLTTPPVVFIRQTSQIENTILSFLQQRPYSLLIAAKHQKSKIDQFIYGSISDDLALQATCPALLLHQQPFTQLKKILVPYDGSPLSYPAIHQGILLAQDFRAELNLLHISTPNESSEQHELFDKWLQYIYWGNTAHEVRSEKGEIIPTLTAVVQNENIDLVIMTKNMQLKENVPSVCKEFLNHSQVATLILHGHHQS